MRTRHWVIGLALACFGFSPGLATAQDVTLRSTDGSIVLEGALLDYDGAFYQIETIHGLITISGDGMTCDGTECPNPDTYVAEIRIAGAETIAQSLLPVLLEGFAASRSATLNGPIAGDLGAIYELRDAAGKATARFTILAGTSGSGFLALLNNETDLVVSLRQASAIERRADRVQAPDDAALQRRVRVLALDAMVPVANANTPVTQIDLQDLALIFSGEIANWRDLGGDDLSIIPHMLSPELGMAQDFTTRVLLADDRVPDPVVIPHPNSGALARAISRDPAAIGIALGSDLGTARPLRVAGGCGITHAASIDMIRSADYPLTAPVYLYLAAGRLPPLAHAFLEFTRTPRAERLVATAGFVNQSLTRTPLSLQGARLANAVQAVTDGDAFENLQSLLRLVSRADRLSATFRFDGPTLNLDPTSQDAFARLSTAISNGQFEGQRLVFIGFSDGQGSDTSNRRFSLRRAEAVRDAIRAGIGAASAQTVTLEVAGFGDVLPVACGDTDLDMSLNRRVEVWVE